MSVEREDRERAYFEYIFPVHEADGNRLIAEAQLKKGPCVWAIVGYSRAVGGDLKQVVEDFDITPEELDAAMEFYKDHKEVIDARLLLNS